MAKKKAWPFPFGHERYSRTMKRFRINQKKSRKRLLTLFAQPWVNELIGSLSPEERKLIEAIKKLDYINPNSMSPKVYLPIQKLGEINAVKTIPILEEMLKISNQPLFSFLTRVLVELKSVKSIPKIEKFVKHADNHIRHYAYYALGQLTKLKHRGFFERLDQVFLNRAEIKSSPYSIVLKDKHVFPDAHEIVPGAKDPMLDTRILELRENGQPKCILGFNGTTIQFVQGIAKAGKVSHLFEPLIEEYLKLMKPLISEGVPIRLNFYSGSFQIKSMFFLRDRFFSKDGVLSLRKKRVKQALGLS